MRTMRLPSTALVSVLAALTTWLTMSTWAGFSEEPGLYLRPLALGCALVAVSGALLRAARLHPALVLLCQVALVSLWLNHGYGADESILGWLPTPDSVRAVLDDLGASVDAAQSYPAPVPESVPAFPPVLIAVGSYCAVLVDLLACGLRRAPLAGLPLLAMYTAPVSLLDGDVAWWKFALVAGCFLFLLAAEEATRLAHWGRDLGSLSGRLGRAWARTTNQTVWPSARKIGFTATAMAVVLPIFVPTFSGGVFDGAGSGGGPGGGNIRITNPVLNMKRDLERSEDTPLLLVTTDDPAPEYLRVAVLDRFDGNRWEPGRRDLDIEQRVNDGGIPAPEGLESGVATTELRYRVSVDQSFDSGWLPVPYPYVDVNAPGDWRYDPSTRDIASGAQGETTAGIDYTVTGLQVHPTADDLRSAGAVPSDIFERYTQVDPEVPDEISDLAARVTAAGTNRAERAALLQDWFAKPHADEEEDPSFEYDLDRAADNSSIEALVDFLQNSRTGYCEQFAGAMALMARTLLIPARVAVGFLKPDRTGQRDSWIYSSHDLHAWPELYFEGVGWVIFEPTPAARDGASSPSYVPGLEPTAQPTSTVPTPSASATDTATARPTGPQNLEDPQLNGGSSSGGGAGRTGLLVALVVLPLLVLLACIPRVARFAGRRRRWAAAQTVADQAEAAWAELRDSMLDLRLPWDDRVTVRHRAKSIGPLFARHPGPGEEELARVIRNNPKAQAALDRIVLLVERARYARTTPDVADVKADVALCVEALRIGVEPRVRRRADWLPASLVSASRRRAKGSTGLALSEPSVS